ncbi:MAG: phosphorylase family protein, partial [Methylomonas sp.]
MTDGNSSLQSATFPSPLSVGGESVRHSATRPVTPEICGIVVALPEEIATLTCQKLAQGECVAISENILLSLAGAGPINAGRAARQLISMGANRLISWGCAAALAPHLKPGDLVIPEKLISERQIALDTDRLWSQRLQNLLPATLSIVNGSLAESGRIVVVAIDKQQIHTKTAAVALDMESVAVAQAAQQEN